MMPAYAGMFGLNQGNGGSLGRGSPWMPPQVGNRPPMFEPPPQQGPPMFSGGPMPSPYGPPSPYQGGPAPNPSQPPFQNGPPPNAQAPIAPPMPINPYTGLPMGPQRNGVSRQSSFRVNPYVR